eukprot:2054124-Alexandrium_andersonii.AAC.1
MSASLVGSEMCIRDRDCREADDSSSGQDRSPEHPRSTWRTVARTTGAVSYTHLTLPTICSV